MPRDDDMMPPNDDNSFNSDNDSEGDEAAAAGAPEGNEAPTNINDAECPFFYGEDGDAMAFCCANCRCSPERRACYGDGVSQACEGDYWHRHCCHNVKKADSNWLPPLQELLEKIGDKQAGYEEAGLDYPVPNPSILTNSQPVRSNTTADTQVRNNDEMEDPVSLLSTNTEYLQNQQKFAQVVQKRKQNLRPAVVLDVFAGVGAALVVLKRLGIAMSKVVHVEHDKIATHVVRHNHDKHYNPEAPDDGIVHVYIPTFEEMEGNVEQFLQDHGRTSFCLPSPCQCSNGFSHFVSLLQRSISLLAGLLVKIIRVSMPMHKEYRVPKGSFCQSSPPLFRPFRPVRWDTLYTF